MPGDAQLSDEQGNTLVAVSCYFASHSVLSLVSSQRATPHLGRESVLKKGERKSPKDGFPRAPAVERGNLPSP